jgi:activator of 2-hydroxyglutaryl-CoA dehydratase
MGDDPVTRRHTTKQKDIEAGSRKSLSPTAIGFGILAMRKVFIGIDGGGTKTKAAVIDHNGNLIGSQSVYDSFYCSANHRKTQSERRIHGFIFFSIVLECLN